MGSKNPAFYSWLAICAAGLCVCVCAYLKLTLHMFDMLVITVSWFTMSFDVRFRNRYHPVCKSQLKTKNIEGYKSRYAAFSILHDHGLIKDVPLSITLSREITKLMDSGEL